MGLTCREVIEGLERAYPPSCAESWDNVGLLVGRMDADVEKVFVALDLTGEVLEEAIGSTTRISSEKRSLPWRRATRPATPCTRILTYWRWRISTKNFWGSKIQKF